MSMSQSKNKDNRKSKTSILFQIKHNTQQNIQVGQSINIISLKTPNKYNNKRNQSQNSYGKCQTYQNINNKTYGRRTNQSAKLTIKLNSGGCIMDEENKTPSFHHTGTHKKIDIGDIVDKFQKKHLITVQKNKVYSDVSSFMNLCTEFVNKIDDLQLENSEMGGKIKKYQNYFKELKVKDSPEILDNILEPTSTKNQKNAQLKILNLERKVQTLNYIIKNYRSNNKQQLKQFEKKVNQYKPTIEGQLTQLLTEANKKNEQLSKMVQYFQKQCQKYYKGGNWVEIVRSLHTKDENIQKLQQKLKFYEQEINDLKQLTEQYKQFKQQSQKLNKQLMQMKYQNNQLKKKCHTLTQQKILKQTQFDDLFRNKQQLMYKYEALIPLQSKIKQKQQSLRRNSQAINRLQNQNYVLKNKIGILVKNAHTQLFNKQSGPIDTIQKCSTTIQELTSRFCQQIQRLPQVNKQTASFIEHLYQKTKLSFQKIVEEYRQQLQQSFFENKQLKNRLNSMITSNKRKFQCAQQIIQQLQNIENKRKRCLQSQNKIQNNQQCSSCVNWILHWGQLNNLYGQMQKLVKKLRQIQ